MTKITNACGTATSTAEQSLQNWIWREALCVNLMLMQTGVEPLATEVGGPRMTSAPWCTHHCTQSAAALIRAMTDQCSAEVLTQFPHHHQYPKRSRDVDFQALCSLWWPSQGVLPEKPPGAKWRGTEGAEHHKRICLPKIPHHPSRQGHSYINTAVNKEGTTNQCGLVYLNATQFDDVLANKATKDNIYVWTHSCYRE